MPNETNFDKRIEELISIMDEENLADAVRIMGKVMGAEKIIEALESAMSAMFPNYGMLCATTSTMAAKAFSY